jgi:MFS family permease
MSYLSASRAIAPRGYLRWLIPPAALLTHLAIGQIYAFSVFKEPLQERFGASHTAIGATFSIAVVVLGLAAAFGGPWVAKRGPRMSIALAAAFWVSGYVVAAIAVNSGSLWLFYLGYGVLGGVGLGIGYVAPVATLIRWFPDRPGLASGMAIMGFGGGALLAAPLATSMLDNWGATQAEALAPTFLALAGINAVLMALGAAVMWTPNPADQSATTQRKLVAGALPSDAFVTAKRAVRTPQFWMLWVAFFANISAGIGILEQASPMIQAFFPTVTAGVAAGFVGLLSLANMGGRFGWSTLSDKIGRKTTFAIFLGGGAAGFIALATAGNTAIALFVALTFILVSFYGGGFSTMPPYLKDLFGERHIGVILGLILTAWSAAGVVGPLVVNSLVDSREASGITGASLYQPSLFALCGLLIVGFVASLSVKAVASRHHSREAADSLDLTPAPEADSDDAGLVTADLHPTELDGVDDDVVVAAADSRGGSVAVATHTQPAPAEASDATMRTTVLLARVAWVVVGVAMVYGLTMTAIKAAALFS